MSIQIQFRRGTTAEHSTFTGAVGEITVDTTKDTAVVHDNSQVGGFALLREDGSNSALSDGSVSAPSIKFSSSTTTGIYSPGANQFGIATNGVGRITIDASGNVVAGGTLTAGSFIPTSSTVPTNGLYSPGTNQLALSTNGTGRVFVDASGNVSVASSAVSYFPKAFNVRSASGSVASLSSADTTTGAADTGPVLEFRAHNGSTEVGIGELRFAKENATSGNNASYFSVATRVSGGSTSEKLRITSAGLMGIGTSSVGARFHIEDTDSSSAYSTASILGTQTSIYKQIVHTNQSTGTNEAGIVLRAGTSSNIAEWGISAQRTGATSGDLIFRSRTGASTSAEFMRLTSTGLGIGTTSAAGNFHINASSGADQFITSSNSALRFVSIGGINYIQSGTATSGSSLAPLVFSNIGGGEVARIDSSGRLLVGTSSARANVFATASPHVQLEGTDANNSKAFFCRNTNSAASPALIFGKTRGSSVGSNTTVLNGDALGDITFTGADGTKFVNAASILAEVDGTPGANDMPGRLVFSTTADGASSPTERMRINSSGNVGVGTSPSTRFHSYLSAGDITLLNETGAGASYLRLRTNNQTNASYNGIFSEYAGTTNDWFIRGGQGSGNILVFGTNNTERARIDSSGRLLVGTSSARGQLGIVPGIQSEGTNFSQGTLSLTVNSATQYPLISLARSGGTSLGSNTIVSNGDIVGKIFFTAADGVDMTSAVATIEAIVDGTPGSDDLPGRLVFSTTADGASSPTERMRITNNGAIEIGTTSDPSTTNFGTHIGLKGSGALLGYFATSRNVNGTNTTAAFFGNAGQMLVKGDGDLENTNNSYGAISDAKLKENIVDASSQWADLKALQVRKYNFKPEISYSTHTQIGLIAQEVELVSPGLVSESPDRDEDGNDLGTVTKSVNYSVLYMKAVKALQEAMERIETLEAKVAALESA